MKALTPASVTAALIVALAMPALANTSTTADKGKGMERATPAESRNANVTTGQNFQDEHQNAADPNTTDTKKVVKKKKSKKARHVAKSDSTSANPPQ